MNVLIAEWEDADMKAVYFDGELGWSGDFVYLDEVLEAVMKQGEAITSIEQKQYDLSEKWDFWRCSFPLTSGELFGFEVD